MNFGGPIIPPNVRAQEEIIRQWYETQIQMANVHSAKAALRITEQVNQTLTMTMAHSARAVWEISEQVNQTIALTMAQRTREQAKAISVLVEDFGRPDVTAVVVPQEQGDTCVAVGTASERDEALPIAAMRSSEQPMAKIAIEIPPGSWMLKVAGVVFSPKAYERIFEQAVADFREEYFAAISKRAGRAQLFFVVARHWAGFVRAFIYEVCQGIVKLWKSLKGAS